MENYIRSSHASASWWIMKKTVFFSKRQGRPIYFYKNKEITGIFDLEFIAKYKVGWYFPETWRVEKDVNRDSHFASSPISQSSFFAKVLCLILASSQRKLRGLIEFLKLYITIKKNKKIQILAKFSIKHHLVIMHLPTKFQLYKSKFAWVRQFWENSQKIKNQKNLNATIDFGEIQYQSSLINIIYLCVVLGRKLGFYES